ncbi:MAG: baseplate J/gp47 family protein [Candidatus Pacebacteria bacterium]|nr:baseplate J/gp47 family protein [Candidatus Paceibacterota bacterium]
MFNRPSLAELVKQSETDLTVNFPNSAARQRGTLLNALARVMAGLAHGLYGFIQWIFKQLWLDTAESESLNRHGGIYGIYRRPAAFASGAVTITADSGTVIPKDLILQTATGIQFKTTAEVTVIGIAPAAVTVIAVKSGTASNIGGGWKLTAAIPIAGLRSLDTAADGIGGGGETETDDDLRARILRRLRTPPQAGSVNDIEGWALNLPVVMKAWVRRNLDASANGYYQIVLYFTVAGAGGVPNLPTAANIATVKAALAPKLPATVNPIVAAPMPLPIILRLRITASPAIKTNINEAYKSFVASAAAVGDGAGAGTITLAKIIETISSQAGSTPFVVIIPAADIVPRFGEYPMARDAEFVQ